MEQWEEGLGEAGEVPLSDGGLVAVGVTTTVVDRAVNRSRVEGLHKRARPKVDGLTRNRHVVGVHDAVDKPHQHPLRDQRCLGCDHAIEQCKVGTLSRRGVGVMPGDRVVSEATQEVDITGGPSELKTTDAQVTGGDPGKHGTWQHRLAVDRATRGHHGQ